MENASKALIMAAGVLIGISILSLAVYLFATFGSSAAQTNEEIKINQINKFNEQYTSYLGRDDLTIYDVVTVANMANENNRYYGYTTSMRGKESYITVTLGGTAIEDGTGTKIEKIQDDYNNKIKEEVTKEGKITEYKCTNVEINDVTKRVCKIEFKTI